MKQVYTELTKSFTALKQHDSTESFFSCHGIGVSQYQWACSQDGEHGERYIPSVRDYESNVLTVITNGCEIHVYRVQNLNTECHGEVTAIEFCYRYNTIVPGEPAFNWTVLIIEETNFFTITTIIVIESHPDSLSGADCMDTGMGQAECCEREYISSFNFQTNNFVFGVTESAQGNTHGATLLGFFESQPGVYSTHIAHFCCMENYSYGFYSNQAEHWVQRGLHMLWFVIGKLHACDAIQYT